MTVSPVKFSMLRACWCFFRSRLSLPTVRSLIKAIAQPVSSNSLIRCLMLPWCSIISITGRVPLRGILLGFFGIPVLGSSFFRFRDASHVIAWAKGCGGTLPFKNPTRSPPRVVALSPCPLFRLPQPSAACWRVLPPPVLPIVSIFPVLQPRLSREPEVVRFLFWC